MAVLNNWETLMAVLNELEALMAVYHKWTKQV